MISELQTGRLVLRAMTAADFPRFRAIWADPSVLRYTLKTPRPDGGDRASFDRNARSWADHGHGQWAICTRDAPGRMIGQTGFFFADRGFGVDFDAAPESGWVLAAEAQGLGFGAEAALAAHRWFDAQPFGGRSHAVIEVGNAASEHLAARLGYREWRRFDDGGDTLALLVRTRL